MKEIIQIDREEYDNKMEKLKNLEKKFKKYFSVSHENPITSSIICEVPQKCIDDFGKDLDKCSTQQNEGCVRCNLIKRYCWKISRFNSNGYIFDDLSCLEDELSDNLTQKEINLIVKTISGMQIHDIVEFYFHMIKENIKIERIKNMTLKEIEALPEFNGW
jgi:hypothetical protein